MLAAKLPRLETVEVVEEEMPGDAYPWKRRGLN